VQVRERRAEPEDRRLEPLPAARPVPEVLRQMLLEYGLLAGVPGALDEIADRGDVVLGAHQPPLAGLDASARFRIARSHARLISALPGITIRQ
jgi:hypothetical protein